MTPAETVYNTGMKRFYCSCGQEVFFDNTSCLSCRSELAFDPDTLELLSLSPSLSPLEPWRNNRGRALKTCMHRFHDLSCNWLLPLDHPQGKCLSCRSTRKTPLLNLPLNKTRWARLESGKRHLFYSLLRLGLPVLTRHEDPVGGIAFDLLEDKRTNPAAEREIVYTGHANGVITINVAEADDVHRIRMQEQMGERYRTVMGHLRHESGHYYWHQLTGYGDGLIRFRHLFGDEGGYKEALATYYRDGPQKAWQQRFISAYASSHPWEDWAESWAHYLHMMDTLETAGAFGLIDPPIEMRGDFNQLMLVWQRVTVMMNSLNRSMGLQDAYPFVPPNRATVKLRFIHRALAGYVPA